ncbi:MAG: orotate phosphoribosyltransferase [Gammaproteobacteria bacterium]|jgi:orotate phosphoribosyltransferase|nr:orotate phosphoribosyltransferase [Gammaproteobacteria bacterium]
MKPYQIEFIEFAIEHNVIKFGEFTLKSGRKSPYFFNAGLFNTGEALAKIGQWYAEAITDSKVSFDQLFGPAYKGIPLVSSVAIALSDKQHKNYPYSFNRKEAKDHGEGGNIVGAPLNGKILVVDDVITAGTAFRETIKLFNEANIKPAGLVIALDRQEKGQGSLSAVQEIEQEFNIPVISLINLQTLIDYLSEQNQDKRLLESIQAYRQAWGIQ